MVGYFGCLGPIVKLSIPAVPDFPFGGRMTFSDRHITPTAITAAYPVEVTSADHGLPNNARVVASNFRKAPSGSATGMIQLNNREFVVQSSTTNTFELYDIEGQPIDGSGYTAFVSNGLAQFTFVGPEITYENTA